MDSLARHWFLDARTGAFWPVEDPVRWCLASAHHPLLERARDRLLLLTGDEEDRITRVVVRRCGLHWIDLKPGLEAHYWSTLADLKPFCRRFGLARPDVRVVLIERKHEVITLTTGSEFLYGTALADTFPVEQYWQKWLSRCFVEAHDGQGASHSPTNYIWKDCEPGLVPWQALKSLWRNRASPFCGNCGLCMFVVGFEWFRGLLVPGTPQIIHGCCACRRYIVDSSQIDLTAWLWKHLDPQHRPTHHRAWRKAAPWTLQPDPREMPQ
jgi:hypothetical protein